MSLKVNWEQYMKKAALWLRYSICSFLLLLLNVSPTDGWNHSQGKDKLKTAADMLTEAVNKGDMAAVKKVLQSGSVNARNSHGETALIAATQKNDFEMVKYLLSIGAKVNQAIEPPTQHRSKKDDGDCPPIDVGATPLIYARDQKIVRLLLDAGADVNARTSDGDTVLIRSASYASREVIGALLNAGANVNLQNTTGDTALHSAAFNGRSDILQMLLGAGATVDTSDIGGYTALIWAASNNHGEALRVLLKFGANMNAANNGGYTGLMLATVHGHHETVKVLIEAGADLNMQTKEKSYSALHIAALNGHELVVETLLTAGADTMLKTRNGETALQIAERRNAERCGFAGIVRLLQSANTRK
ncbi:MAG TPA: ankyrin repeat domain-containing protein [Acidobacteriota bacterium]|nr:ankyrin repeat domain-containing protein [Acidobacteriota bacterium]